MLKRFGLVLVVCLMFASMARAGGPTLWGTVTAIDEAALQVRSDRGENVTVTLTASTQYRKWIMAKPWEQDPRATVHAVNVGKRVGIDFADGNQRTARVVWIVVR